MIHSTDAELTSADRVPFAVMPTDGGRRTTDLSRGLPLPLILAALGLSTLASGILMIRSGLSFDPTSRSNAPYYVAALLVLALQTRSVQSRIPYGRRVGAASVSFLGFTGIALLGAVTSYPIAALSHGYADPALQHVDVALRFDWLAWYRTVADHPVLQWAGVGAYESIYLSPAILLGWFAFTQDRIGAHRFLASFWLSAVLTLALFSLMPAVGPFAFLWHGAAPYMPRSELWQPDLIPALRAGAVRIVDLGELRGLVSAPSFHAAAAALFIVTAWRVAPLRWPLVSLNAAMLLATPVEGTHYLADILMGLATAGAAMLLVNVALGLFAARRT